MMPQAGRSSGWRERGLAAAMASVALGAGLGVRLGSVPAVVAKYAGVGLWCALVYWLIVFSWPRIAASRACIAAVGIGWAVELLQLTPGPAWLAARIPLSRWVLGTTFSVPDLAAYAAGAAVAAGVHCALRRGGWLGSEMKSAGTEPDESGES